MPIPPSSNHVTSPVLEALGSVGAVQDSDTAYRTDVWAKSVPFGGSPPNDLMDGVSVSGSPPNLPRQYERGGFSNASPSTSPPLAHARLVNHSNGLVSRTQSRQSTDRTQRHSMSAPYYPQPPLPHMPQAHFYTAPSLDLGVLHGQHTRRLTEDAPNFVSLDSLVGLRMKSVKLSNKAILLGREGSLDVLAIERDKVSLIGCLCGLHGCVIDAKMLSWDSRSDPFASPRPLVAVILHGPAINRDFTSKDDYGTHEDAGSDHSDILPGLPGRPKSSGRSKEATSITHFQTSVHVYSLSTQAHLATLFTSQPTAVLQSFNTPHPTPPPPVGSLKLHVSGNHVLVSSGTSGEVFIFGISSSPTQSKFQCIGKVWTSVQTRETRRYSSSPSSTDADSSPSDASRGLSRQDTAILSLSGRWLAVVPPAPSSRSSLGGVVPVSSAQKRVPGLDTHTAPSQPSTTCIIDSSEGESLLGKVARGVTQELVKGARWIGDQGLLSWNSYWNKDTTASSVSAGFNRKAHSPEMQHTFPFFPPTHAQDSNRPPSADPELVSIIDLRKLEDCPETKSFSALTPITTFQPPNGCSFLSFAPNGLSLLTASKKGDVQYVWDLMQTTYLRAGSLLAEDATVSSASTGFRRLRVRQIARYARLTTSSIVDVIWTDPAGERFAIITRKGTVHVFDLPLSAFQWPPLRQIVRPSTAPVQQDLPGKEVVDPTEASPSGSPFAAAMKMVGGKTQPLLATIRGRAPSIGTSFSGVSGLGINSATGIRGGKAVTAGLSKSVGAATGTVNTLRQVGENRLHVPSLAKHPNASKVGWIGHNGKPAIAVIDDNAINVFKIGRGVASKNNRQRPSVVSSKGIVLQFPQLSRPMEASGAPVLHQQDVEQVDLGPNITGFWSLSPAATTTPTIRKANSHPLSQAEIETNPPYQPFHTDRRVNLFAYSNETDLEAPEIHSSPPWVFGGDIPASKLSIGRPARSDEDEDPQGRGGPPGQIENLISLGGVDNEDDDKVEHIVITTRRRKIQNPSSDTRLVDEDGFFEDDCEVLDFAGDRV